MGGHLCQTGSHLKKSFTQTRARKRKRNRMYRKTKGKQSSIQQIVIIFD